MNTASFRVSTDILRRLGEELITSFDQGLIELVKNSYDADAHTCIVELKNTEGPGGTVVITDDGDGMSRDDIRDGWLVLGHSRKNTQELTRLGRMPAGSKGLGRLGALRMGEEVHLTTRPRDEKENEYSLSILWPDFAHSNVIEDVHFTIHSFFSRKPPGTRIEIRDLRIRITENEVRKLARQLILLSDPFGDPSAFTLRLVATEFTELEDLVHRGYFDDSEFRLIAQLDQEGHSSAKVFDRSGSVRYQSSGDDLEGYSQAPAAKI